MSRRILFILTFILCLPVVIVCLFSITVTWIWALVVFIFRGDDNDKLMDFMLQPFLWSINLPYKITGYDN